MLRPLFRNRRDAGRRLGVALAPYRESRPIVLALPRGGVPVGSEVAKALAAPLDVLLVRKIGAPGHEELGLGAVVDGHDPQLVLNEDLVRAVARRPSISRQRNSGNWPRLNVAGSTISAIARLLRSRAGLSSSWTTGSRPVPPSRRRCAAWGATTRRVWFSRCPSRRRTPSRSSRRSAMNSCAWRPPTRSMRWGRTMAISGRQRMPRSFVYWPKHGNGRPHNRARECHRSSFSHMR